MAKEKAKSPVSRLMGLAGKSKSKYYQAIVLAVIGVASGFVPYIAVAKMLVALIGGETNLPFYGTWCLIAAAGYVLKVLFATWSTSVSHTATFQVLRDIRKMMISKLSRLPMGVILDKPSGEMKDTIVDRVDSLETTLAHMVPEITANLLAPILLIVYLFVIDWRMALISLITIPVGMVFAVSMTKNYPKQYEGSVVASRDMTMQSWSM